MFQQGKRKYPLAASTYRKRIARNIVHRQKSIGKVVLITMLAILMCEYLNATDIEAKSQYWISAMSYKAGGTSSVKYLGSKLKIIGKWGKGRKYMAAVEKKRKKFNRVLRLHKKCKYIEVEMPKNHIRNARKFFASAGYKKGKEINYIQLTMLVKNNRIAKIYSSA